MSIEEKLKNYILSKFKSIMNFANTAEIPYTTVDNILKRGISRAGVTTMLKICNVLNIDINELIEGNIIEKAYVLNPQITEHEKRLVAAYRNKPEMQSSINKLLDINSNLEVEAGIDIERDIIKTVKSADFINSNKNVKQK